MALIETCCCGAEFHSTCLSQAIVNAAVREFREAHQPCRLARAQVTRPRPSQPRDPRREERTEC